MAAILGVLILLSLLFLVWRFKYRYPPWDVPQVLCYHKLSSRFCFEGTWLPPKRFLKQIDHLLGKGFEFIDENEFIAALEQPSSENQRRLLLTFDDGYTEMHDIYMRELLPRGVPILVFLLAGYMGEWNEWDWSLGRRPFRHLTWNQARALVDNGANLGSHGMAHYDLTRVEPGLATQEITESRTRIQNEVGCQVRSFSYPFGRFNSVLKDVVAEAGYEVAFSLYPNHSNERVDRLALRRNGVYVIDTLTTVSAKVSPGSGYWFEEMKCRTINGVSVLTPLLKRLSAGPDR